MDLDKLKYVITIGEERSFSKAAKKLFISQPALSQYVSNIENELGIKLFNRNEVPITLTTAGEIFIKRSKDILNLKRHMIRDINNISETYTGSLKIGISPFRSPYILPEILWKMKNSYPNVKVIIIEKYAKELEDLLDQGTIDLAIISLPLKNKEFIYTEFYEEETFVITPRNSKYLKLGKKGEISLESLKKERFILPYKENKLREKIESICYTYHFHPNIYLEIESQECILSLIESGLGIGFASSMSLNYKNWKEDLYAFSLKDEKILRKFAVVSKKDHPLNDLEKRFISLLKEIFE